MHTYICMCVCVYIYIYIYIYSTSMCKHKMHAPDINTV